MSVTVAETRTYLGAGASEDAFIGDCLTEASALVAARTGNYTVPLPIIDRAVLATAAALFHLRNAPLGISTFADMDGASMRVASDPRRAADAILDPWVPRGI